MKKAMKLGVLALSAMLVAAPALAAQTLTIDARMNVAAADTGNYFNWTNGKTAAKDKFDAASGASIASSTEAFKTIRIDSTATKRPSMPVALYGVVLYPVSDFGTATTDAFTVTANGSALVVRFVHRGVAYEITTDKNGKFDVLSGAKYAKGLADNVGGDFVLKKEFVRSGGDGKKMADLDWSKIKLVPDAKDASASRWYEGSLDLAFKGNILTVKGTLTEKKAK